MARHAAVGFRAHSGWAAVIALGGDRKAPVVLVRRRLELIGSEIAGAAQLYHRAAQMNLPDAAAFIERCTAATAAIARNGIRGLVSEVMAQGYRLAGASVLTGSGRVPGDLAKVLGAHPLIHTAEGEFYRNALLAACGESGLTALSIREKEIRSQAAERCGLSAECLEWHVAEMGKCLGPPWRQDEKLCSLAAWISLCKGRHSQPLVSADA